MYSLDSNTGSSSSQFSLQFGINNIYNSRRMTGLILGIYMNELIAGTTIHIHAYTLSNDGSN